MADEVISVGTVTNIPGKRKYHKDGSSSSTTLTYSGEWADMSNLYNTYSANGWVVDLEEDDANSWNLTATFPVDLSEVDPEPGGGGTNEIPEVTWDLNYKVENKSVLDIDNATTNLIPNFCAKLISDAIQAKKEEIVINGLNLYFKKGTISVATRDASLLVYHHMATGQKTVPVYVPILTKYAVTSKSWVITWSNQNIGRLYSTSTLRNSENVDPAYWSVMPTDVFVPSGAEDLYIRKTYGWLKGGVRSSVSNNGKKIVTQSWEYGLYPTLYFGTPL